MTKLDGFFHETMADACLRERDKKKQEEKFSQFLFISDFMGMFKGKWVIFMDGVKGIYGTEKEAEDDGLKYYGLLSTFIIKQIKGPTVPDSLESKESDLLQQRNKQLEACMQDLQKELDQSRVKNNELEANMKKIQDRLMIRNNELEECVKSFRLTLTRLP